MEKDSLIFRNALIFAVLLMFSACTIVSAQSSSSGDNPITKFLNNVINFLMAAGGAVGIFLLVIAAFYFLTARGDNSKIEKARSMILWIIIGMAVVLLAKISINVVTELTKS